MNLNDIKALHATNPDAADHAAWEAQLLVKSTATGRVGVLVSVDDAGNADVWLGESPADSGEELNLTTALDNLVEVTE